MTIDVPSLHGSTTISNATGYFTIYGHRAHDGTARFTITDTQNGEETTVMENADWAEASRWVTTHARTVDQILREALPSMNDWYKEMETR